MAYNKKKFDSKRVSRAMGLVDHAITLLHPGKTYIVPEVKGSGEHLAAKVMLTCRDIRFWCNQKKRSN